MFLDIQCIGIYHHYETFVMIAELVRKLILDNKDYIIVLDWY